jgi:hypothetical protein
MVHDVAKCDPAKSRSAAILVPASEAFCDVNAHAVTAGNQRIEGSASALLRRSMRRRRHHADGLSNRQSRCVTDSECVGCPRIAALSRLCFSARQVSRRADKQHQGQTRRKAGTQSLRPNARKRHGSGVANGPQWTLSASPPLLGAIGRCKVR